MDRWYGFAPINEQEEKIMCHLSEVRNEPIADSYEPILKPE